MTNSATDLLYQRESYKQDHTSCVTSCTRDGDKISVTCVSTIFYPQGGGQPTDKGTIASSKDEQLQCEVGFVSYDRETGQVKHQGTMKELNSLFEAGEQVHMNIDWPTRYLHMRLHSGGHLIDHAIQVLGCPFKATKANHFPSGPSVEFQVFDQEAFKTDRVALDEFVKVLQDECDKLIAKDMRVLAFEMEKSDAAAEDVAATHVDKAKDVKAEKLRMILFEGCPAAVPCGGTHVARAGEIGRVLIRKVSFKSQVLRISYNISD